MSLAKIGRVCPICGRTWRDMLQIEKSLIVGELDIKAYEFKKYGIYGKLQHFYIEDNQRKECGIIIIPLATDVFNNNLECVIFRDKRDDPRVYIPVTELDYWNY